MANRFLNNITINDQYTFPSTDGSAGQAIVTDGLGNLTFGSAIASSATSSESVHITVKNTSGATITKGTPVYVTGETGNSGKIEVAPADASDVDKMPALGLLESDLADNAEGFCVQGGLLEGLATATIDGTSTTANDTVYVKAGGGLTMTKPTGTNFIQNIAKVARVHASNGSLVVSSILRTNDVPTPLYIDHDNQRVGIGDTTPEYNLDVDGEVRITDRIGVNVAPADDSVIKFRFDNNDPNKNLAFGLRGDINLSGADNTTGDRNQGGIYLDIDSSADGDGSDIHKLYGIYSDLKFSGYSRTAYGIRSEVEANNDTDLLTTLQGLSTEVIHDTASTGRSQNMHGVFSLVKIENAGEVNKAYGAEFYVEVRPNRTSDLGEIWGSKSHIRIDATAAGLTYDDIIGAHSVISNNEGTTPSGTNTYLFKGEYTGQNGAVRFATNSWGLYVQGDKHYLEGNVGIGTTSPGAKLQVAGNGAFNSSLIVQDPDAPTNGNLALLHDSGGSTIYSNPASGNVSTVVLKLGINNSEKMRIANNGNVGIGTTSPGHLLEVAGNMRLQNQLYDSTNSQGTFNDVLTKVSAGTEWKSISDLPIDSRYVAVTGDTMTGNLTIGDGSADNYVRSYFSDGTYAEMRGYGMQFSRGASYLRPTSDKNLALNVGNDGQTWNQVRLNTNEFTIERDTSTFVKVDSSGKVGIGTTNPSHKLDVVGTSEFSERLLFNKTVNTGSLTPAFYISHTGFSLTTDPNYQKMVCYGYNANNNPIFQVAAKGFTSDVTAAWNNDAATRFTVLADGNVGIGTASPAEKLSVAPGTDASGEFGQAHIGFVGYSGYAGFSHIDRNSQGNYALLQHSNGLTYLNGSAGQGIRFRVNNADHMILNGSGNVGIGTTSPGSPLHVAASGLDTSAGALGVHIGVHSSTYAGIEMVSAGSNSGWIDFLNVTDGGDYKERIRGGSGYFEFHTNGGERMRIDSVGRVGIGTTSPLTKLHLDFGTLTNGDINELVLQSKADGSTYYNNSAITGITFTNWINGYTAGSLSRAAGIYGYNADTAERYGRFMGLSFYTSSLDANATEKMRINHLGYVGIGTTSPQAKLHVSGSQDFMLIESTANSDAAYRSKTLLGYYGSGTGIGSATNCWNVYDFNAGAERMRIDSNGNVGINQTNPSTYKLDVTGTIRATGDVIAYSDIRVKENIKTIDNALDKVKSLRGVEYNKIDNPEKSIGVIAQEIEEVIPEVVREDDQGMKSVAYGNITAVLIEAIKEQQKQIDELKKQLDAFTK